MISGVSILFSFGGRVKPIAVDGHVGQLEKGKAQIQVKIAPRYKGITWPVSVDGKKNVTPKKDWSNGDKEAIYLCSILVKMALLDHVFHTEYPENNMRLVRLDGRKIQIWEISLISQKGEFFVTEQMNYEAACYRDGNKVVCPRFEKWPQMAAFLNQILGDKAERFLPISKYQPEAAITADGLEKNQGRVLWWNMAQGLGAIITPEGSVRVHWSEVAKRPRLAYLVVKEVVTYDGVRMPVQTKARSTSFSLEAVGVKPLWMS